MMPITRSPWDDEDGRETVVPGDLVMVVVNSMMVMIRDPQSSDEEIPTLAMTNYTGRIIDVPIGTYALVVSVPPTVKATLLLLSNGRGTAWCKAPNFFLTRVK